MSAQLFTDALGEIRVEYIEEVLTYQRPAKRKNTYVLLKGCLAACLALILSVGTVLAVNPDARAAFVGWIKEIQGTFIGYIYSGGKDYDVEAGPQMYCLALIPDGYSEVFSDLTPGEGGAVYSNQDGQYLQFSYIAAPDNSNSFVSTGDAVYSEVQIGEYTADFFESTDPEESSAIVWMNEYDHLFYVAGFFAKDELIQIAESVSVFVPDESPEEVSD